MCVAEDGPKTNKSMSASNIQQQQQLEQPTGCETIGNRIDEFIRRVFYRIGFFVASRPKLTIGLCLLLGLVCGAGFATLETENRPEELWVPQNTRAEAEEGSYLQYYPSTSRISTMILSTRSSNNNNNNVLTKASLEEALALQETIHTTVSFVEGNETTTYVLEDLCTKSGGSCASSFEGVCGCLMSGIFKVWNYDLATLQNDTDYMTTLNSYGTREDLEAVLGAPVFDNDNLLVSAEAFTVTYFLDDRSVVEDGSETDPINEAWEEMAFLNVVEAAQDKDDRVVDVAYFATRSFSDEFGDAIGGDLTLVQVSYLVTFLFLGATLGKIRCGPGSRWSMSIAAVIMIALSTVAGFGVSSAIGLFFGPVHSLLPFILLGIGVDDGYVRAFVIVSSCIFLIIWFSLSPLPLLITSDLSLSMLLIASALCHANKKTMKHSLNDVPVVWHEREPVSPLLL